MLFDLRVVLAACLATLFFAVVGFGLIAGMRSPLRASDAPALRGPGLPQSQTLPLPVMEKPEVTGSVAAVPEPEPQPAPKVLPRPAPKAHRVVRPRHPVARKQTITTLIEEDATRATAATAHPVKTRTVVRRRRLRHAKQPAKQESQQTNPFASFMNNNTNKPTVTR